MCWSVWQHVSSNRELAIKGGLYVCVDSDLVALYAHSKFLDVCFGQISIKLAEQTKPRQV